MNDLKKWLAEWFYGVRTWGLTGDETNEEFCLRQAESAIKELMSNNGLECNVEWYDGFLLNYTQEQQDDILVDKLHVNVGDKINVLFFKADD